MVDTFLHCDRNDTLDDHIHEVWYMVFYILVVEYHKGLEGKSLIHHNNKLILQNLSANISDNCHGDKVLHICGYHN